MRRSSFRATTFLGILLGGFALSTLGVVGFAIERIVEGQLARQAQEGNLLLSASVAHEIESFLESRLIALGLLDIASHDRPLLAKLLEERFDTFELVLLATPDGHIVFSSTPSVESGLDVSGRDFFRETLRSGEPYLSPAFVSASRYAPNAVLATALRNGWVAAAYISLGSINRYLAGLPAGSGKIVALVDSAGNIVASNNENLSAGGVNIALESWFKSREDKDAGGATVATASHGDEYLCWMPVSRFPGWLVLVSEPVAEVLQSSRLLRLVLNSLLGVYALIALLLTLFVVRMFGRDIDSLSGFSSAIASGRLEARLDFRGFRDLAKLAADMDAMRLAIAEREAATTTSLKEKEVLLREIHHRVKNNLQVVVSLLSLKAATSADGAELYADSIARIQAMASIHELLYRSNNLASIDLREYAEGIASWLSASYADRSRTPKTIIEMEPILLDLDKAIPCGLILNELLTNSYKYAFRGRTEEAIIRIRAMRRGATIVLSISDNGPGLPSAFDPLRCESLGMQLVVSLCGQIGGRYRYASEGGVTWTIEFEAD